jgi:hypothetical protein
MAGRDGKGRDSDRARLSRCHDCGGVGEDLQGWMYATEATVRYMYAVDLYEYTGQCMLVLREG